MRARLPGVGAALLLGTLVWNPAPLRAASQSLHLPTVPKWARFEQAFRSSVAYEHPLQDATLTVTFTSPLGESRKVYGFWDGGRTWRVRFSPDQPGNWTFTSTCSDAVDTGLNGQSGGFLCIAPVGADRFQRHGPVRVARDGHHLEHLDGTPFFWLADTVGPQAWIAGQKDWLFYASIRSSQGFTAVQWAAAPGRDPKGESALTGFPFNRMLESFER